MKLYCYHGAGRDGAIATMEPVEMELLLPWSTQRCSYCYHGAGRDGGLELEDAVQSGLLGLDEVLWGQLDDKAHR